MRKISVTTAIISLLFASLSIAQNLSVVPAGQNKTSVTESTAYKVKLTNHLSTIKTLEVSTPLGLFTQLTVDDYSNSQETGCPMVPVLRKLMEIPTGAGVTVNVISSSYTDLDMSGSGYHPLIPAQPQRIKSDDADESFIYHSSAYQQNLFAPTQLVTFDVLGFLRGQRLGRLNLSPVQYNPVSQILRVYHEITVEIVFDHPDMIQTRINKQKNLNPFFNVINNMLLNQLPTDSPLDTITQYPVKFVIVSPVTFQTTLQTYIAWKKKKGFTVVEAYTSDPLVGTTTTSIKNYLQGLYNAGTPNNPAPSFVLFVGDVAQVPAFTGTSGSHPTDLYYCEYTGDYLPEVYYGRFSATTVAQLQSQINKTLEYEQYTMPDPSFLNQCVMVAGVDATYGPTHANPQIIYGTNTYFNTAHGLTSHTYLYPNSGSQAAQIIQDVSNGCCFANYTAHGSSAGWASPSFTTANIPSLTNNHKYPLMVGNACLTNKFDESECFGEALLRATNKGAVGYIGASNNTYWDEDYYWSVGAKAVTPTPTYSATALGAYDRTFHDHGEPYSDWFMTQDQMVYAGNLAVTQGSPSSSLYYWEIYHLMGDPSLMIYYSQPQALTATYSVPLPLNSATVTITTEPYAYCAISYSGVLYGAAQANASGIANIGIFPFASPCTADVVVTKQNRQPFTGTLTVANPNAPMCIYLNNTVNDAAGNNNGLVDYGENILLSIGIQNVGLQPGNNITVTISTSDAYVTITDNNQFYGNMAAGSTLSVPNGFAFTVANNIPDLHNIQFLVSMSDGTNTWTGNFTLQAHAPFLTYISYVINDPGGNMNGKLDPGETVNLVITIQNTGSSALNLVNGTLTTTSTYVTINTPTLGFGNLAAGAVALQTFSVSAQGSTPPGTIAGFLISLAGSSGITGSGTFTPIIGQMPVVIINLDGNNNAAIPMQNAILANNVNCDVQTSFPSNLNLYSSIFVCLGIYNQNHVLTNSEGQSLANYLTAGGKLYMEGGDTWYFDTQTPVHSLFKITGTADGSGDLLTVNGQTGTFTSGMSFSYVGDNSWIDRITPTSGTTAFTILSNYSPAYATAIAYEGTNYKTIGASHEFAGFDDGLFPSTKNELMKQYLQFFGLISTQLIANFTAAPLIIDQGGSVNYTDVSTGSPTSWSWSFPGGTPSTSTLQNPVVTYSTAGSFPATLTATNANGSNSLTKTDYITVNPVITSSLTLGSYSGCTDTFNIPIIAANLSNVASMSLTINYNQSGLSYVGYDNINMILGGGILLVNPMPNSVIISWVSISTFSITAGTLFDLKFLPLSIGNYPITFNTSGNGNCQLTDLDGNDLVLNYINGNAQITASTYPVSVSISAEPNGPVCSGTPVVYSAYGTNGGTNPVYIWKKNDEVIAAGNVYVDPAPANGDQVSCELTSSLSCAGGNPATSNTWVAEVNPNPGFSFADDTIQTSNPGFTLDGGTGFSTYQWSNSAVTPSITVTNTGWYALTVTNSFGCVSIDSVFVLIVAFNEISGQITYSNTVHTPLNNITVQLKSGSSVVAVTTTDSTGNYLFENIPLGSYLIDPVCTKEWGGCNATDALMIMKHFVGLIHLTGINLKAADVDNNTMVNAIDALASQKRYVGLITSFPAGDWAFIRPVVTITGMAPVVENIKGLCYGDVNSSYFPPAKINPGVSLLVEDQLLYSPGCLVEMPVKAGQDLVLGAVSFSIDLQDGDITVLDISVPSDNENLVYHQIGNQIRISWFTLQALHLRKGDELFRIKMMIQNETLTNFTPRFRLSAGSEVAGPDGLTLDAVQLFVPALIISHELLNTRIIPNPFSRQTQISFYLDSPSPVTIEIYSTEGKLVKSLLSENLAAGNHQVSWNGQYQSAAENGEGIYFLRISTNKKVENKVLIRTS
ncbi:MAG: C25 family cysteine peptidase [Bacteroidetes bacterium]|nr:C25 family cysteine peptidase [Bacteroidota bacterium]